MQVMIFRCSIWSKIFCNVFASFFCGEGFIFFSLLNIFLGFKLMFHISYFFARTCRLLYVTIAY